MAEATPTPITSAPAPPVSLPTILVSAVALIDAQGRLLLAQRTKGALKGLWELPGGKIEGGETPEAGLVRELAEELGIGVNASGLTPLTFASHSYSEQNFHLLMPVFVCRQWEGTPVGKEGQALAWASVADLETYPMPPADLPLLPAVLTAMQTAGKGPPGSQP